MLRSIPGTIPGTKIKGYRMSEALPDAKPYKEDKMLPVSGSGNQEVFSPIEDTRLGSNGYIPKELWDAQPVKALPHCPSCNSSPVCFYLYGTIVYRMGELGINNYSQLVELYVKEGEAYMKHNNLTGYYPSTKGNASLRGYLARTLKAYFQHLKLWNGHPEWELLFREWTS